MAQTMRNVHNQRLRKDRGHGVVNTSFYPSTSSSSSSNGAASSSASSSEPSSTFVPSTATTCESDAPTFYGGNSGSNIYSSINSVFMQGPISMQSAVHHSRSFPGTPCNSAEATTFLDTDPGQKGLQELEATNRRQTRIFNVLVFLCVIVVVIYIVVFALLVATLVRDSPSNAVVSPGSSPERLAASEPSCPPPKFCIPRSELNKTSHLLNVDLDYLLPDTYEVNDGQFCFSSPNWVAKWVETTGKIYKDVRNAVDDIDVKQGKIREDIHNITTCKANVSANSDTNGEHRKGLDNDYNKAVFAHFFVDVDESRVGNSQAVVSRLKYVEVGRQNSESRNVGVNKSTGQFRVNQTGFYFLYSHVMFRKGGHHLVVKTQNVDQTEQTLLEDQSGTTSILQGAFQLKKDDMITVNAITEMLDGAKARSMYFGMYLIRT